MKSQSQLQQQAVAAAIAKKSGQHGVVGRRRLRRNVDVVVNAMKNRSQSSTQQAASLKPPSQGNTASQPMLQNPQSQQQPQNQQFSFMNMQYFHRKQLGPTASNHSHSQQVLDNSQAIQHKISMYSNQVNSKSQTKNSDSSPIQNKGTSVKVVPSQLQRAYLGQRATQTPNPTGQQQNVHIPASNNIQVQLQQMIGGRRVPTDRNQNHYTAGSYHDAMPLSNTTQGKIMHHASAQNLEQLPRSQSQLSAGSKGGVFVQMKGQNKSNRNATYGGTLTQRQKSNKKLNPNNTLYSQISLKEIHSPGKPVRVAQKMNITKLPGPAALNAGQRAASLKYAPMQHPGTNSAQSFVQYGTNQQQNLDQFSTDMKDQMNSLLDAPAESSLGSRSRNLSNIVSTNGVTHASQGAILNINTASDINIYNNAFIVQSSPTSIQLKGAPVNAQMNKNAPTGTHKRQGIRNGSNQNNNTGQANGQQRNRNAPFIPVQQQQSLQNQSRSKSTGRNMNKSTSNQRPVTNVVGPIAPGQQSKTSRAQAINEAYSSNQTYLINNQQVQPQQQQQPVQQLFQGAQPLTPHQLQQRLEQQQSREAPGVYHQVTQQKKGQIMMPAGKGYSSTEAIKRSEDSVIGGSVHDQRNSSLTKPFYNNKLVTQSQKRSSFGNSNGLASATKRNFKSVKSNRDTSNGRQMNDIPSVGGKKLNGALSSLQKQQQLSLQERTNEMIRRARQKIKAKDYNDAVKLLSEVLESLDPQNTEAIFYRAVAYLDQGNLQQAISELWRVVEQRQSLNGTHLELCQQAYILLAIAHKRLGEHQNAIQDLELCINMFPKYSDAYLARGQNLLLQEEFTMALADFEKFIELNSSPFSGYLGVGDCYKAKKQYSDASKAYTKAIKLLPQQKNKPNYEQLYQQCYMKRGLSGYHEGKHSQALADLQGVIQRDTSNVKSHYYIGKLLAKGTENEYSKQTDAILHFEQVAKYHDQEFYYGNAMFQMAKIRLRQKAYYEAFHCLKRAADNNFASKRLAMYKDFTEGVLYLIKRKIKKGVQILSDLLEILVNKDKDKKKNEEKEGKEKTTINVSQRKANKAHSDYLIHQILHFRAYGYVAIEKYELAQDDIRRVAKYGKVDIASTYNKWLGKGILRMDHEDYLMASKFFTKAWRKFPGNKDPYCLQVISIVRSYTYSLGTYNMDQQIKFDKVLQTKKFMDKAIANCCKNNMEPSLYFFRGLLNFQMHNFLEALNDFNQAIDSEEESSAQFYLARGRTYACLCVLTEAMKDLSVALNLDETLQQAYIYRGKCAYLIGDNNLAFLDFQRLILTDPKNPMVHVYAGNLLMTTGAYQDAIKAYENADTVEPTCISAFQRVRCLCALSDLKNAKIMMDETRRQQPDDVLLNFDSLCLDELIKVGQSTVKVANQKGLTTADVKSHDLALKVAVSTFDELVDTYMSEKLLQLKRRDSVLNIQIIPNVQRVRLEKVLLAQEIARKKEQLTEEQKADLPTLSVDLDEPVNPQQLKRTGAFSYYYENIFNLEDFFLYRGVFKFYQGLYREAIEDFEQALHIYKENRNEMQSASRHPGYNQAAANRNPSGFNSRNHTLQHYSIGHQGGGVTGGGTGEGATLQSNATDLSDVGLSSFNELEIIYNIFICYLLLHDRNSTFNKLNELQRKSQKRYSVQIPLLRIMALEQFAEVEKSNIEISKLQKQNPELYKAAFGNKNKTSSGFLVELFPTENRLCSYFAPQQLKLKDSPSGLVRGCKLQMRLSFSMPFVKPPNMIPNVDEEFVQTEFNLKQIDAPMPEAPWIKHCEHGIQFTDQLDKEGGDREKYLKFFSSKANQSKSKPQLEGINNTTVVSTRSRLINNMVGETLSDRNKISLMEDCSPRLVNDEDACLEAECQHDRMADLNQTRESIGDEDDDVLDKQTSDGQVMLDSMQQDSEDSYDSEDMIQKGATDLMALRESDRMIGQTDDSTVLMGENKKKGKMSELKKMKNEIVEPNLGPGTSNIKAGQLLPKFEENTAVVIGQGRARYAQPDDLEDYKEDDCVLPASLLDSQNNNSAVMIHLDKARQSEPQRLNEQMLAGLRLKERRVSALSISDMVMGKSGAAQEKGQIQPQQQKKRNKDTSPKNKRSKFRTSIDDQDDE